MHPRSFRPRATAVAITLLGGCVFGVTSAHAAAQPDHGGLPNVDRRAADAAPVPAAQRNARRTLDRSLGATGEVRTDRSSGGIARVGRTDALLTDASSRTPEQVVLGYVREQRAAFGLSKRDMANLRLVARSVSPDGITHLRYNQVLDGVLAFDSGVSGHVTRDGRLITVTGAPVPNAELPSTAPSLSAGASLGRARTAVRTAGLPPRTTDVQSGPSRKTTFATGEQAVLRWSATADGPKLAWSVITAAEDDHRYDVLIDAKSGELLRRQDLTSHLGQARYFPADPDTDPREAGTNLPPSAITMPPAWYDDHQGRTRLWGQFARTYLDPSDEDPAPGDEGGSDLVQIEASNGPSPSPDWVYDQMTFPGATPCPISGCTWDSTSLASADGNAFQAATNAHVLVSRFHDHLQAAPIGFDAASGNFQMTNPPGQGIGSDYVQVEVNDGEGFNNANMATPPDGNAPRMQMYLWDAYADVNGSDEAAIVYHEYAHGLSNRLVVNASGASNITTAQAAMMGEAISDFYALDLLVHEGDLVDGPAVGDLRLGTYATDGAGIRAKPIDCPADPTGATLACNGTDVPSKPVPGGYTYGDIKDTLNFSGGDFTPHNGGEVWAETLWEIRTAFGRDEALTLITGGMRLVGAAPSMLDMRDAILQQAVAMRTDPDAQDPVYAGLWEIFRKRGMGRDASAAPDEFEPTESYAAPSGVVARTPLISDPYPGGDNDGVIEAGETVSVHLPVTGIGLSDLLGVTGALSNAGGPALTIGRDTTTWPKLGQGRTGTNAQPLTATLPPNVCATPSTVSIAISSTEGGATASALVDPRPGTTEPVALNDATGTWQVPVPGVTTATFAVQGSGTITDLDLRIDDLQHSWLGDLTVELIHPDGTTATLFSRLGDEEYNGAAITQAIFDDEASATLPTAGYDPGGHSPITGRVRPGTPHALSVFDGRPVSGTWKLRITDGYPADSGSLNRWGLNAAGATIPCGQLEIPAATTQPPNVLGPTAAGIAGSVTPNGRATGLRFAFGTTVDYGRTTPTIDVGAGNVAQQRAAELGGLQPGTTYHYRVEAIRENGQVAVVGEDRTFTTEGDPTDPTGPTGPTNPTAPTDPTGPADPGQPVGPAPTPLPPVEIPGTNVLVPTADRTAPRFVGRIRTSLAKVRGTKALERASFRFRLSEPARVTATVTRTVPGVRAGKRCVAKTKRTAKNARRCNRTVTVTSASMTVRSSSGTATLRLKSAGLPRGDYRVWLVAVDPSGNRSTPSTLRVRVR